jgi:hypothetical protein
MACAESTYRSCVFLGVFGWPRHLHINGLRFPRTWPYKEQVVQTTTQRNSCQNLIYYGLPPPKYGWKTPNTSLGGGQVGYGLEHSYCSDCWTCWNVLVDATLPSSDPAAVPQEQRYIEYLVVEYAQDVTTQTIGSNTTQDTKVSSSYLMRWKQTQVCVVSVGLFDTAITPPMLESLFLKNVDRYLQLLH